MAHPAGSAALASAPAGEADAPPPRECAHCSLPLARRLVAGDIDGRTFAFCCIGCWIAMGVTRSRGEAGGAAALLVRLGLGVFFAMNVMMLSAPSYVPHVYADTSGPLDGPLFLWLRWLAAAFSAPVLFLLGGPVATSALAGLRARRGGSDVLIALGVAAAYALSFVNLVRGLPTVYFDTGAMLLVFVTLGRYLEARARAEATAAVRAKLSPGGAPARLWRADVELEVDPAVLTPGDLVEIAVGGAIPTDGVVERGTAGVDESMLTGESRIVVKQPGDAVAGGTCSLDGRLRVRVTARAADSAAARIESLLASASRERTRTERIADAAAAGLIPLLLAVAIAAGAWWAFRSGQDRGVLVGIAVLVVACPCGFGIAAPLAGWMALRAAARRGVIVRSAAALERLADVRHVVFDKTGTLTEPVPRLTEIAVAPTWRGDASDLLRSCAALEADMPHPLARALATAARERAPDAVEVGASDVRLVPGCGVAGVVAGRPLSLGSAEFALDRLGAELDGERQRAVLCLERWQRGGAAPVTMAIAVEAGRLAGVFYFTETVRPQAPPAIAALRRAGIGVSLLSGDGCADAVVPTLFAAHEVDVGLGPAEKVERLRALRLRRVIGPHRARGAIAMVGDGINDAPALAAADVGIAVAGATDLARLTADAAVLGGDLRAVPWLIAHARRSRAIARQNLAWAFGYNAVAVALAAAGQLSPLVASAAMIASSLAVVLNASRLAGEPRRWDSGTPDAWETGRPRGRLEPTASPPGAACAIGGTKSNSTTSWPIPS